MSLRRHPARARVGRLVEQDPVELECVADRLVDLQRQLVAREHERGPAGRALRCRQQHQGLLGDARRVRRELEPDHVLEPGQRGRAAMRARVGARLQLALEGRVRDDAGAALDALLRQRGAVARRERHAQRDRERLRLAADDAGVDAQRGLGLEQQREALLERPAERVDLVVAAPVPAGRRNRRGQRPGACDGQRLGELDRTTECALEAGLRDVACRGEGEPAPGGRDTDADALVGVAVDPLDRTAADVQALDCSPDPARLRVRAAPRRAGDQLREEVEWRQPLAPVAPVVPVEPVAPVDPSAPAANVAPVAPVDPLPGVIASRSTMKISVELAGIPVCAVEP